MVTKTPEQIADKWARNLGASTEEIRLGVAGVTQNPAQLAIAAKDKMVANFLAAVQSGKWERGLGRVSLSDWQKAMTEIGIPRMAAGATAAKPKMAAFMREVIPHIEQLQGELASMPSLTLDQNIARSAHFLRGMAEFKRSA